MNCEQIEININSSSRGFHLITNIIRSNIPQIRNYKIGLLNLFLKHTSASLTINENMDPTDEKNANGYVWQCISTLLKHHTLYKGNFKKYKEKS